ncbi:hypothetical protein BST61_g3613 [Cercospora zeina]
MADSNCTLWTSPGTIGCATINVTTIPDSNAATNLSTAATRTVHIATTVSLAGTMSATPMPMATHLAERVHRIALDSNRINISPFSAPGLLIVLFVGISAWYLIVRFMFFAALRPVLGHFVANANESTRIVVQRSYDGLGNSGRIIIRLILVLVFFSFEQWLVVDTILEATAGEALKHHPAIDVILRVFAFFCQTPFLRAADFEINCICLPFPRNTFGMAYSSSAIVASTTILLIFLIFFVALRFIARHNSCPTTSSQQPITQTGTSGGIGPDDWACLIAALGSLIGCLLILVSANDGLGRSTFSSSPHKIRETLLFIWLDQINYLLVMAFTKTSTLLLYTRIFHSATPEQKTFRRYCWALIGIVCLTSFFLIVFAIIMCEPVAYFWNRVTADPIESGGTCKDHRPYLYSNTIISIVTDCCVVALPVKLIWGLQMNRKKKVKVLSIFGLGGVVIICSIMRATRVEAAAHRTDPMVDLAGLSTHRQIRNFLAEIFDFGRREEAPLSQKPMSAIPVMTEWDDVELGSEKDGARDSAGIMSRRDFGHSPIIDSRW